MYFFKFEALFHLLTFYLLSKVNESFQRSSHGSGMSKKAQAKRFITELHRMAEATLNSIFTKDKLAETVQRLGLQVRSRLDFFKI